MNNSHYAQILSEIAQLMQIKGANPFKVRAFENAARALENLPEPLEDIMVRGELKGISGIGKSIAADLEEIRETGTCSAHKELLEELDPGLLQMLQIQGLGPKRIKILYDQLGISTVPALEEAAREGRIQALAGFGARTEEKILSEIERLGRNAGRTPLPTARLVAESIRDELAAMDEVLKIEIAGSIRRGRETIGDIDLLVAATDSKPIMERFSSLPQVDDILASGETKTSLRLMNGIQVDLRVVDLECFGSALHYFTGSKEHHIELRTRAKRAGLKINEYGVFTIEDEKRIASRTEEDLYAALDLDYIPPELREGRGEIDAAARHELPKLIELGDVRGDIHMHTTETDGRASILEMAQTAQGLGYSYIAITDHSQAVRVANGMTPERFRAHIEAIRAVDATLDDFRVLAGIEVDILKDGALDMDHDLLASCDWVVGSVHSYFALESAAMTRRLITAMETGLLSCLGHPTGRILGGRDGYSYDMDAVLEAAVEFGVAVEINGSTSRLDFNAENAARAYKRDVKIVLGSDAHAPIGMVDIKFAVQQARRAGLSADAVLNTLSADELMRAVRPTLQR